MTVVSLEVAYVCCRGTAPFADDQLTRAKSHSEEQLLKQTDYQAGGDKEETHEQ
jgi:hypothetical protein